MSSTDDFGIYRIGSPSGRAYIGMTMRSFRERWSSHRRILANRPETHSCKALANASRKYGLASLNFEILLSWSVTAEERLSLERTVQIAEQNLWDQEELEPYNGRPTATGSVFHSTASLSSLRDSARARNPHGSLYYEYLADNEETVRNLLQTKTGAEVAEVLKVPHGELLKFKRGIGIVQATPVRDALELKADYILSLRAQGLSYQKIQSTLKQSHGLDVHFHSIRKWQKWRESQEP